MHKETKRLAIVATVCFFPTAALGWALYTSNPSKAVAMFKSSIYAFMFICCVTAVILYGQGGNIIPVIGSFY